MEDKSIPTFPSVKVDFIPAFEKSDVPFPKQDMEIKSYVRVSDDEGVNYFSLVVQRFTLSPTDSISMRSREMSHLISLFNTNAYAQILLAIPSNKVVTIAHGLTELVYKPDEDPRNERVRMKDIMQLK